MQTMLEITPSVAASHSHQLRAGMPTVLVLDDQSTGRLILAEVVRGIDRNINVVMYDNPIEAIAYISENPVDLVLTDYKMPLLDGIETIRRMRSLYTYEQLPIVMTTVVSDREVRHSAFEAGATDFLIRPVDPIECRARCQNLLNLRQQYLIILNHASELKRHVSEVTRALRLLEVDTLSRVARAADLRNAIRGPHLKRMACYSALIARGMGLSEGEVEAIELAVPMHDLGKVGIPDAVLQKSGPLTPEEKGVMQSTTQIGYDILKDSPSPFLQVAARIALNHHEKFDGTGTPSGLRGSAIPLEARIVALAEVFDAMTSARPYGKAWEWPAAIAHLASERGKYFDPEVVDVFIRHADEAATICAALADQPTSP
ncbi:HD domain-containing phosphohydrolase [Actimicrobium antarcticum]|uniref:Two-component system response regulator n=1 Tax=Actimicrobium antarcticum TaxID=1051899 RepID=A0ABP7TG11_9BURK